MQGNSAAAASEVATSDWTWVVKECELPCSGGILLKAALPPNPVAVLVREREERCREPALPEALEPTLGITGGTIDDAFAIPL